MGRVLKPKKETFLGRSVCGMFSATQWAQSSVNLCHEKRYLREVCYLLVIINNAQKNIFMMFLQARLEAFGTHHRFVLKCWIILYFQEYTYLTFENGMYKKALNFKYFKYFKYFVFAFTYMYSGSVCCVFE